jgi:outer membrane biosynthesis protein TonB
MRLGMAISAMLHLAALAVVLIGLPSRRDVLDTLPENIPVDFVVIEDQAKMPKAPEPPPEPVAAPAPPPAAAVPLPVKPRPKPRPAKKPPQAKRPPLLASVMPRVKPRAPRRFDTSSIAALLDTSKRERETAPPARKKTETPRPATPLRRSALEAARLTASLKEAMRRQIERCWSVPAGAREAENLVVHIRVTLNPDGSLARPPEILDRARLTKPGEDFFRSAAESARRAVQKCAPLKLPRESYDIWRITELVFDPSKMLGV